MRPNQGGIQLSSGAVSQVSHYVCVFLVLNRSPASVNPQLVGNGRPLNDIKPCSVIFEAIHNSVVLSTQLQVPCMGMWCF